MFFKTKIKKLWVLRFSIALGIITLSLFVWTGIHGSSFRATIIRGISKVAIAVAPKPKPNILLDVKFDKQDHALSCEVAALKMVLAYRGVKVDESELIKKVGFDRMWGDPQKAFVGNIDGKMLVTGYGVYWKPIARVANDYQYAVAFENFEISDLVSELQNNNPVIIWGYLGSGKPTKWKTKDGNEVMGVYYEHTFVVHGFSGSPENPEGFFVIDPIYGHTYFSKETFLKKWDAFSRSGVVVY